MIRKQSVLAGLRCVQRSSDQQIRSQVVTTPLDTATNITAIVRDELQSRFYPFGTGMSYVLAVTPGSRLAGSVALCHGILQRAGTVNGGNLARH